MEKRANSAADHHHHHHQQLQLQHEQRRRERYENKGTFIKLFVKVKAHETNPRNGGSLDLHQ